MSRIVTFYSYKGGVGRTFALANIGILLARKGKRVLLMDWDLEAPGLDRYFDFQEEHDATPDRGVMQLLHEAADNLNADWRPHVRRLSVRPYGDIEDCQFSYISSGSTFSGYADLVRNFSWHSFLGESGGGAVLERWRREWRDDFDLVLIDSRTGITDTGGICTILLPDFLVMVFSANEQSFGGTLAIAASVRDQRRRLSVQRPPPMILPLLGRFDRRDELAEADKWLRRFASGLRPFYADWLPKRFEPSQILEVTKIPYVTRFSFGEPLPVLTHSITDPELPGFFLENCACILASDFAEAARVIDPSAFYDAETTDAPIAEPDVYLNSLLEETAFIEIRGLSTGAPQAHRYPIGDLYIEIHTARGPLPDENRPGPDAAQRPADRATDHALRAALVNPRLVISGDPGCGKTTFLRWVAHCLAAARLGREPDAAARHLGLAVTPLPVLVRIGDWLDYMERVRGTPEAPKVADSPDWLPAFLGAYAAEHRLGLEAAAFRRLLDDGEAMLLFDGLDEAPDRRQRAGAARIIEHAALAWPRCPLVVTSRPAALAEQTILPGFAHTAIERLDETAIAGFLDRWSRALFRNDPIRAAAHRRELAAALASRPEIRRLARNVVMLTALAVVHWNDKRLPEQRAELYESIIRWLLLAREYRHGRAPLERSRQLLADLALAMQTDPRGRATQLSRRAAAERIAHRFPAGGPTAPEPVDQAEAYLAAEELDSGIVVRRGHDLRYWHLTFQEYLAAWSLAGKPDAERAALLLDPPADPPLYRTEWRETVLLLGGVLFLQSQNKVDALVAAVLDRLGPTATRAGQARAAGLIGALVRDLAPFAYKPADLRYAQVLEAALAIFDPAQASAIPLAHRIAAAEALAQAGDLRLGWDNPGRWVELPGRAFTMGAQKTDPKAPGYDPEVRDDEAPVHEGSVGPLRIGRYPVAVAEFTAFLEDEDCRDPRWWRAGGADEAIEPDNWEDQQAHPSRPVVYVSWYQAMAYCAWLTDRLQRYQGIRDCPALPSGWVARLPTEAEWEHAARGSEGRRYPWGAESPDPGRANFDETKLNAPSPVGVFPGGATAEGIEDLAGNVWEWCLDGYSEDFYAQCQAQGQAADPCAMAAGDSLRVLRGGSFADLAGYLRASSRGSFVPVYRGRNIGFRCTLAAPRQPFPSTH